MELQVDDGLGAREGHLPAQSDPRAREN